MLSTLISLIKQYFTIYTFILTIYSGLSLIFIIYPNINKGKFFWESKIALFSGFVFTLGGLGLYFVSKFF